MKIIWDLINFIIWWCISFLYIFERIGSIDIGCMFVFFMGWLILGIGFILVIFYVFGNDRILIKEFMMCVSGLIMCLVISFWYFVGSWLCFVEVLVFIILIFFNILVIVIICNFNRL